MHLFNSNRLEHLRNLLAALVSRPLDPMQSECIMVQTPGMAHWLSMGLAENLGVWMNAEFPFPQQFIDRIQGLCDPNKLDSRQKITELWSRETLQWVILAQLPQYQHQPEFQSINQYLQLHTGLGQRWQLARRIADSFDQYMVYRPDMLITWQKNKSVAPHHAWQAILWRDVCAHQKIMHRGDAYQKILTYLKQTHIDNLADFPERVSIFGISTLPPIYLDILAALSKHIEVNILMLNPCQEFWGDLDKNAEISSKALDMGDLTNHALLSGFGGIGRDFLNLIYPYDPQIMADFQSPDADHLLANLQTDMLHFGKQQAKQLIKSSDLDDGSIQIHSCHTAMREVEILHDQLLHLFAKQPDLKPADVLIMTPKIEDYAPLIQAVFESAPKTQQLAFHISDRSVADNMPIFDSFLILLQLPDSRLSLYEVLALLETPAIQDKFELQAEQRLILKQWLQEAKIHWGINATRRAELDLPEFQEYSWQQGLDRLILGYTMPERMHSLFVNTLAVDAVEGQQATVLGQLLAYTDTLFQAQKKLQASRTATAWQTCLQQLINDFFIDKPEYRADLQQLHTALSQLQAETTRANFEQDLPLSVIQQWFQNYLSKTSAATGFVSGEITCCALLPMRSIPFAVVCLLGMNEHDYPRSHHVANFDLINSEPRLGDHSCRQDDRYLFLESLLSARDVFYISYIGQDIQDNGSLPPSIVITELLQHIQQKTQLDSETVNQKLGQIHPLQAFNPRYFQADNDSGLFSYAQQACLTSQKLQQKNIEGSQTDPMFMGDALAPPENLATPSLSDLIRFIKQPSDHFLRNRLGIRYPQQDMAYDDDEPVVLDDLQAYQVKQQLITQSLSGKDTDSIQAWLQADGQLPPALLANPSYQGYLHSIQDLLSHIQTIQQQTALESIHTVLTLPDGDIEVHLHHLYKHNLLCYYPVNAANRYKGKQFLEAWIQHLVLNICAKQAEFTTLPCQTEVYFLDEFYYFEAISVDEAEYQLNKLLNYYQQGLQQPLPFFPNSAYAYIKQCQEKNKHGEKKKSPEQALRAVNQTWLNDKFSEAKTISNQRCFAQQPLENEFGNAFSELAEQIILPLWAYKRAYES